MSEALVSSKALCLDHERLSVTLRGLTLSWSGRVKDRVPSSNTGVRAAQLNR